MKFLKSGKNGFCVNCVNFCGNIFCGFFFGRNLVLQFGQKFAKTARINSREIFFLHGISFAVGPSEGNKAAVLEVTCLLLVPQLTTLNDSGSDN